MPDEPWHGTINGYRHCRCRCQACTAAHREWRAAYRARPRDEQLDPGGWPLPWVSDSRVWAEIRPAPLDLRWVGLAKRIRQAVQAG